MVSYIIRLIDKRETFSLDFYSTKIFDGLPLLSRKIIACDFLL